MPSSFPRPLMLTDLPLCGLDMLTHAYCHSPSNREAEIQQQPLLNTEFEVSLSYIRTCLKTKDKKQKTPPPNA